MRISDWSSDVCSSDLFEAETHEIPEVVRQQESLIERVAAVARKVEARPVATKEKAPRALRAREKAAFTLRLAADRHLRLRISRAVTNRSPLVILTDLLAEDLRSEERRGGNGWVRTCK